MKSLEGYSIVSKAGSGYDTHHEPWPLEQVLAAGLEGSRTQRRKFQDYIEGSNPALAEALAEEEARFDIISSTVIEPAMNSWADKMAGYGWQVAVVRDTHLDRPTLLGTRGIRFYCDRELTRTVEGDLIWPSPYIAFYGCVETKAVHAFVAHAELYKDTLLDDARLRMEYQDVALEVIHTLLASFVDKLLLRGDNAHT